MIIDWLTGTAFRVAGTGTTWAELLGFVTGVLAAARRPALYLLTDHRGVPFTDDGLRDGEHLRAWMTERFRAELAGCGVPAVELTGSPADRLARAVRACDAVLAAGWSLADPIAAPDSH
ncbi:AAA family ATPase [Micromonospora sp. NPDC049047]|uniref:AAA family ATPase n=1 Tax=Micromonospora sp. NPDC049047 TaxID=3155645 RepID=UPI0033D15278